MISPPEFRRSLDDDCHLRELRVEDSDALFSLNDGSREHLRHWLPWIDHHQDIQDARVFILRSVAQKIQGLGFWSGIWVGDQLAGVAGFHPYDLMRRSSSVGYWLGKSFEGRGLMTRTCRALFQHAFESEHLDRIAIHVAPGNKRSTAIPKRLGMRKERVLRQAEKLGDRYVDHVVFCLYAKEWQAQKERSRIASHSPRLSRFFDRMR